MELEEPLPSDCCGSGCSPCVFDLYQQRLEERLTTTHPSSQDCIRTDLLSETRFKPFRLLKKNQIADSVFEFRFQPILKTFEKCQEETDISGILPYSVGQHLFLRCGFKESSDSESHLTNEDNSNLLKIENISMSLQKPLATRAYTPITLASEEKNCCFNIFVKLYKNGIASEYFKKSSVGDIFYWRGPYGSYKYKSNTVSHILMLCIGTGLAPMISVIQTILNNESDETVVHLKCGFKNINHVILRNELKKMAHFWNCTVEYYFSEGTVVDNSIQFGEQVNMKKLDKYSVEDYLKNRSFERLSVLICGTESFTSEMKQMLADLNIINTNVYLF